MRLFLVLAAVISAITGGRTRSISQYTEFALQPGEEAVLAEVKGPGALKYFYLTDGPDNMTDRQIVLRIYWDGCDYPSVNVPLADFFGIINGRPVEYVSKYLAVHHCCNQCYFPMPFRKGARICICNDSPDPYSKLLAYGFDFDMDRAYRRDRSRFHACYSRSNPTEDGLHTVLDVRGHGQYVGNFLHVFARTQKYWGEGDTYFLLDGTQMMHTPGTEDEYGSCYDFGRGYNQGVCGYIEGGLKDPEARWGAHDGHNRFYRFYDSNPVRFRKVLKVTMQNQFYRSELDNSVEGKEDYTTVAYYYLDKPQPVGLVPYEERVAESAAEDY